MDRIENLSRSLGKLPGIGPRQAKRLSYFLLRSHPNFLNELSKNMLDLKSGVSECASCYRFFSNVTTADDISLCFLCRDESRDSMRMLILEKDIDYEKFQKSGYFDGKYFIVGGTVPILEKNPEQKIRLNELVREIERRAQDEGLKEIIFAFSANPEGENTIDVIKKTTEPIAKRYGLTLSILGRGLSTGTEIEYSDDETLRNALENRK